MIVTYLTASPDTRSRTMALIEQPWTRVRTPVPIPDQFTPASLTQLSPVDFAELVRSNLNPADPSKQTRLAWNRLWETLRGDPDLTERAYDVLEEFQDLTEDALGDDELDEASRKRAEKFLRACAASWQRINREPPQAPLAWAGKAGKFPAPANRVIAVLVSAIATHRHAVNSSLAGATDTDQDLWAVLHRIGLDPDDYPSSHNAR